MTKSALFKKSALAILPTLFWVGVWQAGAMIIDNSFLLPDVFDTASAFNKIICESGFGFFLAVLSTLLRVLLGLFLGVAAGIILAVLSHRFTVVRAVISPAVSVIKATPVASFIIILWILLSGDALSVFVAFLMVMPIIWQNLLDGYDAIDKELVEISVVFELSFSKKMRVLVIPTLMRYLIPATITAVGLAWKSEIAAEIIAYTRNSIGQYINDSKYLMDSASVFAYTIVVIVLSILLEKLAKFLLRRCEKWLSN